ncbi:hypothetical protein [Afipia sp. GAS231]|uniref:hypothetical protein n=1 Tax=Afipia sp. GAS231 TaxID=1882747 RepID=UPI00087DCA9C|nr:hypothetical protein [Afipia sp. GAS231]SDO20659.1 hypothetical protein SAMN05444050_3524 [Afipia sp. GAS231]
MTFRPAVFAVPFCLALAACSGGEPSQGEMKNAFDRAMRAENGVKSTEINEFNKVACKAATDRPGYMCDFFADANITIELLGPQKIRRNLSGRFFADKDGALAFAPDSRG